MRTLLLGTHNAGKRAELVPLFAEAAPGRLTVICLTDLAVAPPEPDEPYANLWDNARHKALAYANATGHITVADDSGLFVSALDDAPGVYSARYAGPGASDADRRARLLAALADVPPQRRAARFACVMALARPGQALLDVVAEEGVVVGVIAQAESSGAYGFGYDPVFIPEGHDVTFADLPRDVKAGFSHRGRAAHKLLPHVRALLDTSAT